MTSLITQILDIVHYELLSHNISYFITGSTLVSPLVNLPIEIGCTHHDKIKEEWFTRYNIKTSSNVKSPLLFELTPGLIMLSLLSSPLLLIYAFKTRANRLIMTNYDHRLMFPFDYYYRDEMYPTILRDVAGKKYYGPGTVDGYLHRKFPNIDG
jgi:hypothetical protein